MADYQLTKHGTVVRQRDGANIPDDPRNADRAEYERWLVLGNIPDPAPDPPPPPPNRRAELLAAADQLVLDAQAITTVATAKAVIVQQAQAIRVLLTLIDRLRDSSD